MVGMKKWILGAVLAVSAFGLGATKANAARIGIYVGAPAVVMPPCPGPGYIWQAGYWDNGYWVPGAWVFSDYRVHGPAVAYGYYGAPAYRHAPVVAPRFDRDRFDRDRGWRH